MKSRRVKKLVVRGLIVAVGLVACGAGLLILVAPGPAYALFCESPWTAARINESKRRGDEIVAALKAYKGKNGVYPDSLSELVPGFLTEIRNPTAGTREWSYAKDKPGQGAYFHLAFGSYRSAMSMSGGFYPSRSTQGGTWYHDE